MALENLDERISNLREDWRAGNISSREYSQQREAAIREAAETTMDYDEAFVLHTFVTTTREHALVLEAMMRHAAAEGFEVCSQCGARIEDREQALEIVDGDGEVHLFCNVTCAGFAGWRRCGRCSEWFREDSDEAVHATDGMWLCSHDCAHEMNYEECENCGDWYFSNYGENVDNGSYVETYCSESCAIDAGYIRCRYCDEWVTESDTTQVRTADGWEPWCDSCADDHARDCYECGDRCHDEYTRYADDVDEWYCPSCYGANALHAYGYRPEMNFFGDAKKSPYLGVELETDGGDNRMSYVRTLNNLERFADAFWMTKDSSLNNGVEVTSHPCTLAYHANELRPTYEAIREAALRYGFGSHDGGRCGLHVHVNRDFFGKSEDSKDLGGYKMMRLLQRFEAKFTKFSRRRDNGWCRYSTYDSYGPDEVGEPDDISRVIEKAKKMGGETRHEQALNFQHYNTFEFRIFRGTLNLSTFYACLGMVNGICHVAKMHSAHYVETVEWVDLMNDVVKSCDEPTCREYLRDYLERKELL